ncbi:MAG: glycosyltransferase, partial [Prochlorococcaceae cyanobacterium]
MTVSSPPLSLSVVLATFNEKDNLGPMLEQLKALLGQRYQLELVVVDDDSPDGTSELARQLARQDPRIHLIRRVGRSGLSSAIREGLLAACGEVAVVMDADGQHEPEAVQRAVDRLLAGDLDLVMGSRFHPEASIAGLSASRQKGSERANQLARFSLPAYAQLSDYMSGFFALRLDRCNSAIRSVDVSGFKFLYELLAVSKGQLKVEEIPLN